MIHRIMFAMVVSAVPFASAPMAQEAATNYVCKTDFSKSNAKGFRPKDVAFQVVPGAKRGQAVDPLNYHFGKIAKSKQRFSDNGTVSIAWRMQVPTTEGFQMGGNMSVEFDPNTMTGTIRSHIPSRLLDGGTVKGQITCKKAKALPRKQT